MSALKANLKDVMSDYAWPMANGLKPFKHQIHTAKFAVFYPRCFILNDLGTGKTLSALWAADYLIWKKAIRKVLIISPLSTMRTVWKNEIDTHLPHRSSVVAHGIKEYRSEMIRSKNHFVIINHDGVRHTLNDLLIAGFDLIIIDEMTAFKSIQATRWKSLKSLADKTRAVWALTGEPTPNSPVEAFAQVKIVTPQNPNLPQYITQWRNMVVDCYGFSEVAKPDADKKVHLLMQPAIRYKRDDCVDLPPTQYIDLPIDMTEQQTKAYKKMMDDLMLEFSSGEITASNSAVKAMKLLQIAAGWLKTDDGRIMKFDSSTKLEALVDLYHEAHNNKLIIFCAFRASVEGVHEYLKSKGLDAEYVHGGVNINQRQKYFDAFQKGSLKILVMQPQAVAHGLTLTAASTIVWHGLIPSGEVYNQANARIIRIGQTKKQVIYHMLSCQADKRILKILKDKSNMSQGILAMFGSR